MIGNKLKRNLWLTLSVMSVIAVVDRSIRVVDGSLEWWNLASAIVITAFCTRFYLCCRKQVKRGNLFGPVSLRDKEMQ